MKASLSAGTIFVASIAVFAAFALPVASHAQEAAAVQTRQLLPPNGTSCSPLAVSNITPYVYDGELNSFEVTLSNTSYVAILGTVGNEPIGFQYMTRRIMPDGQLRIHVDVPIQLAHSGIVTITLLSSQGGVTCASTVAFGIAGIENGGVADTPGDPTNGHIGSTGSTPAGTAGGGKTPSETKATSSTTVTGAEPGANTTFQSTLNKACSMIGSLQLWFILIAAFIVVCALTALNEAYLTTRSEYLPAALILAPLVLLLGFWFIASACRGSVWVPIMLLVAAAAGLLATFRNHKAIAKIIELPPAKTPKK